MLEPQAMIPCFRSPLATLTLSLIGLTAGADLCAAPAEPAAGVIATTTEYTALCKHQDATRKTRYTGPCEAQLESGGEESKGPYRYTFVLPDKTELAIVLYVNGLASVNGLPARRLNSPKGTVRLLTAEDEEVLFTEAPLGSL